MANQVIIKIQDINIGLIEKLIYADDTDFIRLSLDSKYLDSVIFRNQFNLLVNVDKTERTTVGHQDMDVDQSLWKNTRKLGSLLGVEEDVKKRMQLANVCFNSLKYLWRNHSHVAVNIRIQSYRAFVESVLMYNCGTWALTASLAEKLDCFQRKLLRRVLGLKWSDKVTNESLYKKYNLVPASIQVINARWRLFGHILRLNENTPERQAMISYFDDKKVHKGRSGNFCTIATILSDEYKAVLGTSIKTKKEYDKIVEVAKDRFKWKELVESITLKYSKMIEIESSQQRSKQEFKNPNYSQMLSI